MSDENQQTALTPIEERQVEFYGDEITAALVWVGNEQQVYIPIRPICEYLGLDWSAQYRRLKRDVVMAENLNSVAMTATELPGVGKGKRDLVCLPLEYLPGWLFGIDATRVKSELQDKILRYQRECFKVLWQAFQADALAVAAQACFEMRPAPSTSHVPSASLLQIREMGLAIAQLAEQQIALEQQVDEAGRLAVSAHDRLDKAALAFLELKERIGTVEKKLAPPTLISETQATEIMLKVKALAEQLTPKDSSKNQYQAIYQELYRRFGVSSYRRIRTGQFEAVMKFLDEWQQPLPTKTNQE